jgi:flagellin
MVINTNVVAQNSARILSQSSQLLAKSLGRLSSGSRLTSPEDDAAGLAVSMRFDAQINRIKQVNSNLGNALSFSQTQDGFLKRVGKALDRMSELAVLSQDSSKTDQDRSLYNKEFQKLTSYINDIVTKDFNGISLFSATGLTVTTDADGGTFQMTGITASYVAGTTPTPPSPQARPVSATMADVAPGFTMGEICNGFDWETFTSTSTLGQVVSGFNSFLSSHSYGDASYDTNTGQFSFTLTPGSSFHIHGDNILSGLGFTSSNILDNSSSSTQTFTTSLTYTPSSADPPSEMDISTVSGAASALTTLKASINQLGSDRASVGASISRLSSTMDQLGTLQTNISAANSRIADVDVAEESAEYARYKILEQAGTAMLAQANSVPSMLLRLLS